MKIKIVIVEDDALLSNLLVRRLTNEGYEVTFVIDGRNALSTMRQVKPALVLLDLVLPTINGLEILEQKNADPAIAKIPVIVISNSGQPAEISRIVAQGVNDYFIKAELNLNDVVARIQSKLEAQQEGQKEDALPSPLAGAHILWVEDDPLVISIIIEKAKNIEATLTHTADAEEALQIAGEQSPSVIVLDKILPNCDGLEILEKLKKNPVTKNIPVIMLSNIDQKSDVAKARALGAARYLVKAMFTLDQVFAEIKDVILKFKK